MKDRIPSEIDSTPIREALGEDKEARLIRLRGPIGSLVLFGVVTAIWHAVVANGIISEIILPRPLAMLDGIFFFLRQGFFYEHLAITTFEVVTGFLLGTALGFLLGLLLGTSQLAREVAYPYVVAFQGLPKVVLAPVFVTALGYGLESKIAMATAMCFFPVLINTMAGLRSVDPEAVRFMRSLTATSWQVLLKLALPNALPFVFAGIKAALTFALIGAIIGEFVGASQGLGFLLSSLTYQLQIPEVWAVTAILAALGVLFYLLIEWVSRKVVYWQE